MKDKGICFLRALPGLGTIDILNDALIEIPFDNLRKVLKKYHIECQKAEREAEADNIINTYPGY